MRRVLVYDSDGRRLERLCEAVRAEGAEPVPVASFDTAALRMARTVQVALAAGEDGVDVLACVALDRPGLAVSLVLVDLDDLRGINDRHGREVRDLALRHVSATLMAGARAVDRVGRWAGGTLALLLPETGSGAAYELAERLRADVTGKRSTPVPAAPGGGARSLEDLAPRLRLTVSCGVACTIKDGAARAATLVQRCDAAFHRAKKGGRNRSVVDG
jgi:diguanylate cyclase (GGDEF)-like protein